MVQFDILSGKKAGNAWTARRFPVRIGRAAKADLQLEESGVWDRHVMLECDRAAGFVLHARDEALVRVNGDPVREAVLRNGDVIDVGSIQLQFWLSPTRQTGLRVRETLTWLGIAAVVLAQVGLLFSLLL